MPPDTPGALSGSAPLAVVAVRALCEFTARHGDLDLRFTPSPTGAEGVEGHGAVTARRGPGYQREVPLSADHGTLRVRGRADGWDPAAHRLEEIKTHRGDLARQSANQRALHWAQARVYGWLICQANRLEQVELALVYFNIDTRAETVLTETADAPALRAFFEDQCRRYLAWAAQEAAHRAVRDAALAALAFPRPAFRAGQRDLAGAVYRVARAGRVLMAQAPTGIGKTLGTLYPLLRAMPPDPRKADGSAPGLDRVFYLAAKTPGRRLALDALASLRERPGQAPLPLRVLELTARDKACEHPDKACHGESCPLARGFWDRLPAARQAAVDAVEGAGGTLLDKAALRTVALAHSVCPYYLAQELSRWADVVVGDYNYWFDSAALLHALTVQEGWRAGLLVDEAHNLTERARAMYSASLDSGELRRLRAVAPPALRRPLERLSRRLGDLRRSLTGTYQAFDALPDGLVDTLHTTVAALSDLLAEHPTLPASVAQAGADLQGFYFDALAFLRLAESFGPHALVDATLAWPPEPGRRPPPLRLTLRNVVPAPHLAPRWAAAHTAVLFSATLSPREWHADLLGLPERSAWLDVPSPFAAGQLTVHVAAGLSTRWQDRAASSAPIVAVLARQFGQAPGQYLAFFSSYEYLQQVFDALAAAHPDIPAFAQQRAMDEPAREAFLARFTPGGRGIGFAVLGGAFAEGIDLPGDRLIGAFVATLGLPQVNPVNEQMRQRLEARFPGRGYDYTYLYPGLQKVVQAAGRVIRTPDDRGTLWLLDQRFARREVRALLPGWWGGAAPGAAEGPDA
jgi:DNA excision repair protein ERCC-2